MRRFKMTISSIAITAEVFDTPTADAICDSVSFLSSASVWGEEVYFSTPVSVPFEPDAPDIIKAGELEFWVEGDSIAIGYGLSPISEGNEIRLAAPANIWTRAIEDVRQPIDVPLGGTITVEEVD